MVSSWRLTRVVLCVAIALIAAPSVWAYWPTNPPTLPAKGGKYIDPSWGTTVMRVTDATDGGDWGTVYSYWPAFNKDNTHLLVYDITNNAQYVQHFDATNFLLVGSRSALFPTNPPGGGSCRQDDAIWSGVTPTLIYAHEGLRIWSYNVDSATWTLIKDFTGAGLAGNPTSLWQMHRSMDDNVFSFTQRTSGYVGYAAWKRDTNQLKVNVADTTFDEVQVDKSGRYLLAKLGNSTDKVYDMQLGTTETLTDGAPDYAPGHSDNLTNINIGYENWLNRQLKRNFATPHSFSVVRDWGDNWVHDEHISCLGNDESKVAMSSYSGGGTPPDNYLRDEVFLITVDGNETVTHLCHHYSHYTDYYSSPRGNVSRDHKYFAYTSNYANQGRLDLFIVQIPGGTPQPPVANFTGNPTSGYIPLTVAFTDTSSNSPTAWSWTFGDSGTSTAQNPSHQYTGAGNYTVSLTATNSAGSDGETKTNYITASTPPAPPVANFTGAPTSGNAPLAVSFTDTSTNSPTSWSWTFGDSGTSTVQNPSHTYVGAGNYTVSLTATNAGGSDGETKTNYISVQTSGAPTFVAAGAVAYGTGAITPALPAGIAANDILLLSLETANQAISISNQNGGTWSAVANSPQGTGTAGGTSATRLTAFWSRYNGTQGAPTTSDSGNHQIGRIIAIRGAATSGDPWNVTAGGVESTADTSGAIPGATTTVASTLVVAAIATSLPDANGTANFSAWTNANLVSVTERTDNTRGAGNGGGLAVATGEKATAGAYGNTTVTCGTAAVKGLLSIALKPAGGGGSPPVANFTGSPTSGTAPLAVSFTDTSTNTPTSWSWTFGDSNTSTVQNPSHSYAAGTYTVSLTATNAYGSDGETKTNYITASPAGNPPVANFTGSPTSGTAPLAVSFTDTSTNSPTAWSWTFGDSSTSTVQNPSHSYAAGTYTVSLTATNAYGSDGETKTNYITATSGGSYVYVYPDTWTTDAYAQVTLVSGGLSDLQSDNGVYMVLRCNNSSQRYSAYYTVDTAYTPSQVNKITVEWQAKDSQSSTPGSGELSIRQAGGTWFNFQDAVPGTSDTTYSWETTAVSTYMSSTGVLGFRYCACPNGSTMYDISSDLLRFRLDLN